MPHATPVADRAGHVVAVVSGKGGVGKTSLAVNIAIELARTACPAILIDADFGLANADILLQLTARRGVVDLLDERLSVADVLAAGPCGARVACGLSHSANGLPRPRFGPVRCARVLNRLRGEADVLLIDCGAGLGDEVTSFAMLSDLLMIVTTPEPTALTDAYATIKTLHLRGYRGQAGVVVNMAARPRDAESAVRRLQGTAARFLGRELRDLGRVPLDRCVQRAVFERCPVLTRYPHSRAAHAIAAVAEQIRPRAAARAAGVTIWQRVAGLFL